MKLRLVAIVAIASLVVSATARAEICGDVNLNNSLTTSDALLVLKSSVGQEVSLQCPSIAGLTGCQSDLTTAMALETASTVACFLTEDAQEGARAFVEKRPPRYRGR